MDQERVTSTNEAPSYAAVLKELGSSARDMVHSEFALVKAELTETARNVGNHASQAVIFSALLLVSVIPFVAFLVIGLGELLGGQYWLSSLIVSVVFAAVGGAFAYRAYRKIREEDLDFSRLRRNADRNVDRVEAQLEKIKEAVRGERYERLH